MGLPSTGRTAFPAVRHALALKSYANLSRRVEWSNSSVIFSPHASEPRILARHFSSSKHFNIPTPTPILSQPDAFDPPTVISLAPGDVHLFAYFPPGQRYSNGTACLWKRGQEIDSWTVGDSWTIAPSAGIVAASWLGSPREVCFNACISTYALILGTSGLRTTKQSLYAYLGVDLQRQCLTQLSSSSPKTIARLCVI